ncbi:hypothetical protein TNCV_1952851 [Trichonephila clavipes]|nr:hypothetical protein TNCV_1952851 [Trichonephila clavipes]
MVWGAISSYGLGSPVALEENDLMDHYRSILTDDFFTLHFRLSFRQNVLCSKVPSPLLTCLSVFKHRYRSIMMKENTQRVVPSILI